MTESCSPFQDVRVGRGVGLDPGAETEEAPPPGLEADPNRGREEDRDALVAEAIAVREGTAGVARDHHQETERDDDGQGAGQWKEAEQRGVGLAVVAAVGLGGGGDSAQDHPAMTAVDQAGEESEGWTSVPFVRRPLPTMLGVGKGRQK